MTRLTRQSLAAEARRLSGDMDRARWALAELAARAKVVDFAMNSLIMKLSREFGALSFSPTNSRRLARVPTP